MNQNHSLLILGITATATAATIAVTPDQANAASLFIGYKGRTTANLNVRKTPSTAKPPLAVLKKGTTLEVIGKNGDWLKIKYKGGQDYVYSKFIKKVSETSAASSSAKKQSADLNLLYTGTVTADYLNVRASANAGSTILGLFKKGTSVSVVGTSGSWLKVKYKSGYAYVSGNYIKKTSSSSAGSAVLCTGTVTADYLNIRSSASAGNTILGLFKKGTSVSVVGTSGSWLKVKYKSGYAYVSAAYIKKQESKPDSSSGKASPPAGTASSSATRGVTTAAVHIRSQAKMGNNILATFSAGTTVTVAGETADGWLKINYKNTYAYVYKDYVSGGTGTTATTLSKNSSSMITNYSINFGQALIKEQKVNSSSSVSYYLNPKNFTKGTAEYYQFLKLSSLANIGESDAAKILAGRGILSGHADDFLYAAKKEKVNEIYLMAHALLETGSGTSQLAGGIRYRGVTVYNFFGIGAYDGSAVQGGAAYAYNQGWTSPRLAIDGGAAWIARNYIYNTLYKQDTLYKMRWNPAALEAGAAAHQYATDPSWAFKQTAMIQTMYQMLSHYTIIYDVPAYK